MNLFLVPRLLKKWNDLEKLNFISESDPDESLGILEKVEMDMRIFDVSNFSMGWSTVKRRDKWKWKYGAQPFYWEHYWLK